MNKELVDYVSQQLGEGVSQKKIAEVLSEQGWQKEDVDAAFAQAGAGADQAEGEGGGRKVLFIGAGAVALLAVALLIFAAFGAKKPGADQTAGDNAPANQTENSGAPVQENQVATETVAQAENVDPQVLAAIPVLEKTITPPSGWVSRQGTVSARPLAIFFKPVAEKDSSGKEIFNENISVTRDTLAQAGVNDIAAYLDKSKTALQKNQKIVDYKIISEKKATLAGADQAVLISGSFTQNGMALKNMQLYAFKGGLVYIVTGFATVDNWDSEKDMIGQAIMSFKFPAE
jgi:hypothetical protein